MFVKIINFFDTLNMGPWAVTFIHFILLLKVVSPSYAANPHICALNPQ